MPRHPSLTSRRLMLLARSGNAEPPSTYTPLGGFRSGSAASISSSQQRSPARVSQRNTRTLYCGWSLYHCCCRQYQERSRVMPIQHTVKTMLAVMLSICLVCATNEQPLSADSGNITLNVACSFMPWLCHH